MQSESENLFSFEEGVNINLFFSGAQRRKIVEEIKKAIFSAVPVITISGDEGAGKTMICRMVEKELSLDYSCVYLPNTPESFDDVVRVLARVLGTESSGNSGSSQELVAEIKKYLEDNDRRLVAIFDRSERMYLAILERIRKMLDQTNSEKVLFHIILSGRKTMLENLKQLSICNFESVEEKSFSVNPLNLSETYAYLNSTVYRRSSKGKSIFTPEAAKKIYTLSNGNFRMTNMLAEKSLESSDPETSFMVLLENVHDNGSSAAKPEGKVAPFQLVSGRNRWVAGAVALLLVVIGFYFFGDDSTDESLVAKNENRTEIIAVAPKGGIPGDRKAPAVQVRPPAKVMGEETGEVSTVQQELEKPLEINNEPEEIVTVQVPEKVVDAIPRVEEEQSPLKVESVEEIPLEKPTETVVVVEAIEVVPTPVKDEEEKLKDVERPAVVVEEKADMVEKSAVEAMAVEKISEPADTSVMIPVRVEQKTVESEKDEKIDSQSAPLTTIEQKETRETELSADKSEKVKSPVSSDEELATISESSKRKPLQQKTETGAKKIVNIAPATVQISESDTMDYGEHQAGTKKIGQLYQQRIAAASRWVSGNSSDKHTVQIMVLTSEQAEGNLRKRFEQDEYREIADDLYVIKNTDDSSVFVYYGEFADPDSARRARNTLPIFLRKHNPYVISVENAVKKATSP